MISLCIIAKNNQEIERCIESVKNIVGEIIIVDTGSSDNTKEIAGKFTTKIFDFKWNNNFSEAKNFALNKATGDWILALDADETITEQDLEKIKQLENNKEFIGFSFIQRNYINGIGLFSSISCKDDEYKESAAARSFQPRRIVRMFKNDSRIKFEGAVHDSVEPSILKIGKVLDTNIPIHHFGMLSRSHERTKMYIEIEKNNLTDNFFQYYQIAAQLHEIEEMNEAVKYLNKSLNLNDKFYLSWLELGIIFLKSGMLEESLEALKKAEKLGEHEMIYFNLGVLYGKLKNFQLSLDYFKKALLLNQKNADTYFNLAITYANINNQEESKKALEKAKYLNQGYEKFEL